MVRFIIFTLQFEKLGFIVFTFQYGQIYYHYICFNFSLKVTIYIPIWLDLLSMSFWKDAYNYIYLHSNMVRFIIQVFLQICTLVLAIYIPIWLDLLSAEDLTLIGQEAIYIPIWLDLLLIVEANKTKDYFNLHSNMVRFIIYRDLKSILQKSQFTFQYGQIYYLEQEKCSAKEQQYLHSNMVRFIIK